MWSSSAVTVTLWATFQLPALKVKEAFDSEPWPGFVLLMLMVTGAIGLLVRATLNDAEVPVSEVGSDVGVTVTPATSASLFSMVRGLLGCPLLLDSALVGAPVT